MARQETIIFYSKDFFGDAVDASLTFYKEDQIIYRTTFSQGRTEIKMPSMIKPGVYDIVASRDGGEYRVNNLMLAMASHYFAHASKHSDVRISDGNIKKGEVLDVWKFNPILLSYFGALPDNAKGTFDYLVKNSANPESLRWGGVVKLDKKIRISRGEAFVKSRLIAWGDTSFNIPAIGSHRLGIKNGVIVLTQDVVDYKIASVDVDSNDWARLRFDGQYHSITDNINSFYFESYESKSEDVTVDTLREDAVYGILSNGKIYGESRTSIRTDVVRLDVVGTGPVLVTDRLYVYATDSHFLLWEGTSLHVALPRWTGSHLELDWSEGVVFSSKGNEGSSRWSSDIPYLKSYVTFKVGATPVQKEVSLKNIIAGNTKIAGNVQKDWEEVRQSSTSTIAWS